MTKYIMKPHSVSLASSPRMHLYQRRTLPTMHLWHSTYSAKQVNQIYSSSMQGSGNQLRWVRHLVLYLLALGADSRACGDPLTLQAQWRTPRYLKKSSVVTVAYATMNRRGCEMEAESIIYNLTLRLLRWNTEAAPLLLAAFPRCS